MRQGARTVGHPVDVATGTVFTTYLDCFVQGRIPVLWKRCYSTAALADGISAFGRGWLTPYYAGLEQTEDEVLFRAPDGTEIRFQNHDQAPHEDTHLINLAAFAEIRRDRHGEICVMTWGTEKDEVSRFYFKPSSLREVTRPHSISDNHGNFLELKYDKFDRLIGIFQRREQRQVSLRYNENDLIAEAFLELSSGRTRKISAYGYQGQDLIWADNAAGERVNYSYNDKGLLETELFQSGCGIKFQYDDEDRCVYTCSTEGRLGERRLRYFPLGMTIVSDSHDKEWIYRYNTEGQVTSIVSPLGHTSSTVFDEFGRIIESADENDARWQIAYDSNGNVGSLTDPLGNSTTFVWDLERQLTEYEDSNGAKTSMGYNAAGKLIWVKDALENTEYFDYDSRGDLVRRRFADGRTAEVEVDSFGNPKSILFEGGSVDFLHDDEGYLIQETNHDGRVTRYQYDALGNFSSIELSSGDVYTFNFTGDGRLHRETGPNSLKREYQYTACGNLAKRSDSEGRTFSYIWGTEPCQLLTIVNPKGEEHNFYYDDAGRLCGERDFSGKETRYELDPGGHVVAVMEGAGGATFIERNALGRVVAVSDKDGQCLYEYDGVGNIIQAENRFCSISTTYDALGRVISERRGDNVISTTYDGLYRKERRTSWGGVTRYDYDRGVLRAVAHGEVAQIDFERIAFGRISGIRRSNRVEEVFQVDEKENCVARTGYSGGSVFQETTTYFRAAGLVDRIEMSHGQVKTFQYDSIGRLRVAADSQHGRESFDFDLADNLTKRSRNGSDLELGYGEGNRLVSALGRGASGKKYSFDSEGRLDRVEGEAGWRTHDFDQSGLLVSTEASRGEAVQYRYDPFGRRIEKRCGGQVTEYLWDQYTLAAERTIDVDGRESKQISYVFEPDQFTPLLRVIEGRPEFFHTDHLGTPLSLTDEAGREVWRASYDAFGAAKIERCDTAPNNIRFAGQYFDVETGYHYNYFRYYDPETARYISPDPIGLYGGANTYIYSLAPTMFTDPLGLTTGDRADLESRALAARGAPVQSDGQTPNVGAACVSDQAPGSVGTGANSRNPSERGRWPPVGHSSMQGAFDPRTQDPAARNMRISWKHAEVRALARMARAAGGMQNVRGSNVTMVSTGRPCPYCQCALQTISNRTQMTITVHHPDDDSPMTFRPGQECEMCGG
ncbi:MAG: RHS repeat-associated core domain-containing protein [Kiloniellales bacterium]|nr:RHS repeat-associated core domain-containing protein [Kiloniellales bacterium]